MKKILVGVAMSACALSAAAFDGLWNPERGFARPVNPRTVWFVRVVGGRRLAQLDKMTFMPTDCFNKMTSQKTCLNMSPRGEVFVYNMAVVRFV